MIEPTPAAELLAETATYLAALHRHAARHDSLGAGYGCAGCQLLARLTPPHGAPDGPPAPQTHAETPAGTSSPQTAAQRLTLGEWRDAEDTARTALTPPPNSGLRDRIAEALETAHREWMRPGSPERPMLDALTDAVMAVVRPIARSRAMWMRGHDDQRARAERAEAQVRRVRQMAHAWREQLPETIRTDTAVQALLDATTPTP